MYGRHWATALMSARGDDAGRDDCTVAGGDGAADGSTPAVGSGILGGGAAGAVLRDGAGS